MLSLDQTKAKKEQPTSRRIEKQRDMGISIAKVKSKHLRLVTKLFHTDENGKTNVTIIDIFLLHPWGGLGCQ